MKRLFTLKKIAIAAIATAGLTFTAASADAGHGCGYAPAFRLQKVVSYHYDYVDAYRYVTRYHPCGTPYQARILYTRKIATPVISYVKVWN